MSGLLRICTAGNVDDGKSTLIGRLLYDSRALYEDQVQSVTRASATRCAGPIDFSLFTDGLRAEREQGITIDVAYRYFATARRKFILADTPGHEQYTRNMVTGASNSDVILLLIDARYGVRPQSQRHARIALRLGITRFVLAINKMDLVDFDPIVFDRIRESFAALVRGATVDAVPISALHGDNIVTLSERTPWFKGPPLFERLETMSIGAEDSNERPFRLAVQLVIRTAQDFRGYAGRIYEGAIWPGTQVAVWPSGDRATVTRIVTRNGDLATAEAPMSVVLTLDRELDISRGDVIAGLDYPPLVADRFDADVVWMDERALDPKRVYLLKQGTRTVTAQFDHSVDLNEMEPVGVSVAKRLAFDRYSSSRHNGSFIIIDPSTNFTSGAGMILNARSDAPNSNRNDVAERLARLARCAATDLAAADAVRDALDEMLV